MARMIVGCAMLVTFLGLAACNTMSGLGRDIERGGAKLENAAERQK